jgi:peptidyl-prolyl cis-trans isomerase C
MRRLSLVGVGVWLSLVLIPAPAVLASAATDADASRVVASRGGVELLVADVDAKIRSMPPDLQEGYLTEADRVARLIDSLLLTKQLAHEAERNALDQDPEFRGDLALKRAELLAARQVQHHFAAQADPDIEALAHERYLASPEQYRRPPKISLRHILISTEQQDDEAARALAEEALRRARAGEDFVALVREYDPSPDAAERSFIGDVDVRRLDRGFAAALRELKDPGDITGPAKSRFGYHVIRLEKVEVFDVPPFEQLREEIGKGLMAEARTAAKNRYLSRFSQLETDIDYEVLATLPQRYIGAGQAEADGSDSAATAD